MARTGQRRLSDLDPERHEPVLRTRLLAADPDDVAVCRALFDVLLTTRAAPLWRAAGARLAACARQEELADWTADTFSAAVPLWRVQPLCHNPAIAAWLLEDLANYHPHTRVAAIKALAPRIHEPDIHRAVLACLHDTHMHVCSTALEVLRPVAGTPAVRDALLALYGRAAPLKGCVDRALRRCLRAAAGDEQVRRQLVRGLRGPRAWIAAEALAGAPCSEALADELLAVLAVTEHLFNVEPAFTAVARLERVTAAFLPRLTNESERQSALRIVGKGTGAAACDAVIAALAHAINWIRWTALQQLGTRLEDPVARAAAVACLGDEDDSVRMIAVQTLAPLAEDADVRGAAYPLLKDPSEAVVIAAAGLLARTHPDEAWAALAPFVTEERMDVYTKQWQRIDPFAQIGGLIRMSHVRDAVAPVLAAYRAGRRAAAARLLRDATPCAAIADRLAASVEDEEPKVAGEAYATLAAWCT